MSQSNEFEKHTGGPRGGRKSKDSDVRCRYVEGDYGEAGTEPGRLNGDDEGRYAEGDYGTDGTVGPQHDGGADGEADKE